MDKKVDISDLHDEFAEKGIYIQDVRGTKDSFLNPPSTKHVLDENIKYGSEDYPTGYFDWDLFHLLKVIDENHYTLDEAIENININAAHGESLLRQIVLENIETDDGEVGDYKDEFMEMPVSELSALLKSKGLNVSGKKKKLVKLAILNNVVPFKADGECRLSKVGAEFVDTHQWIDVYDKFLSKFEFNDIYRFVDEKEDYLSIMINLLDDYESKAHEYEDFEYFDDCLSAKSNIYEYMGDSKAIEEAIKRFILRLNPIYSYSGYYDVFDEENIHIISCGDDIENKFGEVWDELDIDYIISKDEAYEYLSKALKSDNLDKLSHEYFDKYLS